MREWCLGPGVPNDEVPGSHYVAPEWQGIAWHVDQRFIRRDRPGDKEYVVTRPRCRVCSQIRRDYLKHRNRLREKARSSLGHHAKRYAEKWGCSRQEARRRLIAYGWSIDGLADLLEQAQILGTCPKDDACGYTWDLGPHDMTIDVKDPDALPLFATNVWVICRTCNTRKQSLRLSDWREFLAYWRWVVRRAPGQLTFPEAV